LRYDEAQFIATMKGVSDADGDSHPGDSLLQSGRFVLQREGDYYAVMGARAYGMLGVSLQDESRMVEVFSPNKRIKNSLNPADDFTMRTIRPTGVLQYHQEFDDLFIVPMAFAQDVLNEFERVSAVEVDLNTGYSVTAVQRDLSSLLGENYVVKD